MKQPKDGAVLHRTMNAEASAADGLIELSVSSEAPYQRSFGLEILEHRDGSVDMSRLLNGAPVLVDHNTADQVGVVEHAWIAEGKLRAHVRFSKSVRGQEIEQDIRDGIRRNISIGYMVTKWDNPKTREMRGNVPVYRAVSWLPTEVSSVAVPADNTVGVGRAMDMPVEDEPESVEVEQDAVAEAAPTLHEQLTAVSETLATIVDTLITDDSSEKAEDADDVAAAVEEDATPEVAVDAAENEELTDDATNVARHITIVESNDMKNNLDTVANPQITLTEREQKQYSLARAILHADDSKRSGFEFEISDEIAKKTGRDTAGFFMPTSVRATYNIGDAASAGASTFTEGGEFIDYLRNRTTVAALGATVLSLNAKTALPRATSDLSAQWIAEDGSGATTNAQTFDQVTLNPKKLATYTGVTREALLVASMDVEAQIRNNIYSAFAVAFDRAAIQGTGASNQPTGIINMTGLVSGSNTGTLTYAGALELFSKVAEANADMGSLAFLTTPYVKIKAMSTIRSGSTADFIVSDAEKIGLYDIAHSNNVPTGYLIFGDWTSLLLAEFGAIEIITDPYTSKHKGIVEIGATMLGDIAVKQGRSFAVQKSLT